MWVAAVAVAVTALIVAACSGGTAAPTPTPTLPGSTVVPPDESTPTPTPLPPVGPSSYRFLYSEFGADEDTIWRVNPADTTDREEVARLGHKSGSAVVPALSPDGTRIAFNVLTPAGFDGATDAEAHVLDLESGEITVVARGVDLSTTPIWSPDGALLFLRRNVGFDVTVILVELSKPGEEEDEPSEDGEEEPPPIRTVLRQDVSDVLSFIPVGTDPDDAVLFFVQVQGGTQRGTFLGRYAPATGEAVATATAVSDATATAFAMTPTPTPVSSPTPTPTPTPAPSPTPPRLSGTDYLFLSDQTAFDFSLSPDSSRIAFLVPSLIDGQFVSRTHIADLAGQQVSALSAEGLPEGEHLRPVWHPEGDRVAVGQLPAGGERGRVAVAPLSGDDITFLQTPDKGFDVPLAWSPDGRFLAVASFSGGSLANSGPPRLVFVATSGQRLPAQEGSEIQAIGWVEVE